MKEVLGSSCWRLRHSATLSAGRLLVRRLLVRRLLVRRLPGRRLLGRRRRRLRLLARRLLVGRLLARRLVRRGRKTATASAAALLVAAAVFVIAAHRLVPRARNIIAPRLLSYILLQCELAWSHEPVSARVLGLRRERHVLSLEGTAIKGAE